MAVNEDRDIAWPEESEELEVEAPKERGKRLRAILKRLARPFVWLAGRVALAWRWLRRPGEVGKPVTLQPRGVQVLVLLIVANLIVLGLLASALYQAATQPPVALTPQIAIITAEPALISTPSPGPSPTPFGSGGAIAFTLRRDGNTDIYVLNQADRQLVQLTYDPAQDRDPAWSPDGDYVAFSSNRADNWDIYLLDLVSGALIRLTHDPDFDANPSWSPDDQYIAFESYRRGNLDIYVMSTTEGTIRRITTDRAPDYDPAWSPNGRAIAFTSFRDGNTDIYLYLVEERRILNITGSPDIDEGSPSWSPDSTQLAYVSGPRSNSSIQVATFDWETMATNQAQTELLSAGVSPAWAPDGQNLVYAAYEREERSHLIAASMTGWAMSQEVYSIDGLMDDLAWTRLSLAPRVVDRAQAAAQDKPAPLYRELVQPTLAAGPPYRLVILPGTTSEDGQVLLTDRVNEGFDALRQRVIEETGWDYLGTLSSAWRPMTYTPPSGHSRMSWHVCGRAIGLDQEPYEENTPRIELVREDVGSVTYWRVFIRTAKQDGSMGEPLREAVWDLNARQKDGRAMVEGGEIKERIPAGYYVDLTALASDYGWQRLPSLWRWRYFWPDIRWWELQKADGLTWWECMLEIFEPGRIESAFGPIPEYED